MTGVEKQWARRFCGLCARMVGLVGCLTVDKRAQARLRNRMKACPEELVDIGAVGSVQMKINNSLRCLSRSKWITSPCLVQPKWHNDSRRDVRVLCYRSSIMTGGRTSVSCACRSSITIGGATSISCAHRGSIMIASQMRSCLMPAVGHNNRRQGRNIFTAAAFERQHEARM